MGKVVKTVDYTKMATAELISECERLSSQTYNAEIKARKQQEVDSLLVKVNAYRDVLTLYQQFEAVADKRLNNPRGWEIVTFREQYNELKQRLLVEINNLSK